MENLPYVINVPCKTGGTDMDTLFFTDDAGVRVAIELEEQAHPSFRAVATEVLDLLSRGGSFAFSYGVTVSQVAAALPELSFVITVPKSRFVSELARYYTDELGVWAATHMGEIDYREDRIGKLKQGVLKHIRGWLGFTINVLYK